jgi:hypothetical protein
MSKSIFKNKIINRRKSITWRNKERMHHRIKKVGNYNKTKRKRKFSIKYRKS